jgi:NADPH:quinone reductase-like Zn-dependent oxidoreductase
MTRIIRFHEFGGPEVLRIDDVEVPLPGAGEVRIRTRALGLNRAEALMRRGAYIETPQLPSGIGLEASGVVEALGAGVYGLSIGDAVSVIPPISMIRWPAHGELATFPAKLIARHPPSLSWENAAALWMPFLTAYGALVDIAGAGAGDFVAVTAASSSVGLAAMQIANLAGATPIAITRTSAKRAALERAGARHVIAAWEEDLAARLIDITGPSGVRVILDAVGGSQVEALVAAMSVGGTLFEYGGLSAEPTPFPLGIALGKSITMRGYLVHEIVGSASRLAAAKEYILSGVASGALCPTVARVFPFERVADAHRYLEANDHVGKVVVSMDDSAASRTLSHATAARALGARVLQGELRSTAR